MMQSMTPEQRLMAIRAGFEASEASAAATKALEDAKMAAEAALAKVIAFAPQEMTAAIRESVAAAVAIADAQQGGLITGREIHALTLDYNPCFDTQQQRMLRENKIRNKKRSIDEQRLKASRRQASAHAALKALLAEPTFATLEGEARFSALRIPALTVAAEEAQKKKAATADAWAAAAAEEAVEQARQADKAVEAEALRRMKNHAFEAAVAAKMNAIRSA